MSPQRAALDTQLRAATLDVRHGDLAAALGHLQEAMRQAWRLRDRAAVARIADMLLALRRFA